MALEIDPPVGDAEANVVRKALNAAGVPLEASPPAYGSRWRLAAAREAVENEPDAEPYAALSPRSTRGATRA